MLKSLRKALSIEDIRKRLLYTLAMLIVVRLGSQLPTPGVDPTFIQNFLHSRPVTHLTFLRRSPAAHLQECQYLP